VIRQDNIFEIVNIVQTHHDGTGEGVQESVDAIRDLLESLGAPLQRERVARVTSGRSTLDQVRDYLPRNFTADVSESGEIEIRGYDTHGWTLDGYVIPRLASGLIAAREVAK